MENSEKLLTSTDVTDLELMTIRYFIPFFVIVCETLEQSNHEKFIESVINFEELVLQKYGRKAYPAKIKNNLTWPADLIKPHQVNLDEKNIISIALNFIFEQYNPIYTQKLLNFVSPNIFKDISNNAHLKRHKIFHTNISR